MRKKMTAFLISAFMLFTHGAARANASTDHLPPEMIVLKSPDSSYANWKEVFRCVTEKEGVVHYIPLDQQLENWSEFFCFQFFDKSSIQQKASKSIEDTLEFLREGALALYPGGKVTWKVIEKNKTNAIYESILHEPYKNIAPEHLVSRIFLTDIGLHRVGFTRKTGEMGPAEREQSIKLLRDSASVVSTKEAQSSGQGLSILDRLQDPLDLGETFNNWKIVKTRRSENGYTSVIHVPPSFTGDYVTELLEVTTIPNIYENPSMDLWFEAMKESFQEQLSQKIEFRLIKQADKEIIYSFMYPHDNLQVTEIVRFFISDQWLYSISYKYGQTKELEPEEVQLWKARLEEIKICNPRPNATSIGRGHQTPALSESLDPSQIKFLENIIQEYIEREGRYE